MKYLIFLSIIFLLSFTSAYYVERALPEDSVGDFWVTYNVHSNENFVVSIEDKISGGCTLENGEIIIKLDNSDIRTTQIESTKVQHKSFLIKRNGATQCAFVGSYIYNSQSKTFKDESIIFNQDAPNRVANCFSDESLCNTRTEDYSACIDGKFVFLGHVDKKCGYKERFREPGVKWFTKILDFFKFFNFNR